MVKENHMINNSKMIYECEYKNNKYHGNGKLYLSHSSGYYYSEFDNEIPKPDAKRIISDKIGRYLACYAIAEYRIISNSVRTDTMLVYF